MVAAVLEDRGDNERAIERAVDSLGGLRNGDAYRIAGLGLSIYESMVVGCLRKGGYLMAADHTLTPQQRTDKWEAWFNQTTSALNGALRYREREPLVITIALTAALLPGLYPHAQMIKVNSMFQRLKQNALRQSRVKRERERRIVRLDTIITRVPLWITPHGEVRPALTSSEEEQQAMREHGCRSVWGARFEHELYYLPPILTRLDGVLSYRWGSIDGVAHFAAYAQ